MTSGGTLDLGFDLPFYLTLGLTLYLALKSSSNFGIVTTFDLANVLPSHLYFDLDLDLTLYLTKDQNTFD